MYYVGLNIHQCSTSVEILDCNGKLVKRSGSINGDVASLSMQLRFIDG